MLDQYLRKGGFVIFEAFSKKHLGYVTKNEKVGGPKDLESLFSIEKSKPIFLIMILKSLKKQKLSLMKACFITEQVLLFDL
jgi:hypothetical protein